MDDYKLELLPKEEKSEIEEYRTKITFTPEQEIELIQFIENNLAAIEKQRNEDKSVERWGEYENQYWGEIKKSSDLLFNTHVHMTLKHCRLAQGRTYQAFFLGNFCFGIILKNKSI